METNCLKKVLPDISLGRTDRRYGSKAGPVTKETYVIAKWWHKKKVPRQGPAWRHPTPLLFAQNVGRFPRVQRSPVPHGFGTLEMARVRTRVTYHLPNGRCQPVPYQFQADLIWRETRFKQVKKLPVLKNSTRHLLAHRTESENNVDQNLFYFGRYLRYRTCKLFYFIFFL